jgi:AAA15 family ATPase/GTPase
MLVEYRTSNTLSFKDMAELSMVASKDKTHDGENTFIFDNIKFLRSAVIYGANGSGKTNLINTFSYMRSLVLGQISLKDFSFKLDSACRNRPSYFEVVFYDSDNKRYRYGFETSEKEIVAEWLFYAKTTRETMLFTREKQDVTLGRTSFNEGKGLIEKTKEDKLFLSVVSELNGEIAQSVTAWFNDINIRSGLVSSHHDTLHKIMKEGEPYRKRVLDILHSFDIQMEDFVIKERAKVPLEIPNIKGMPENVKKLLKAMKSYMDEEDYTPEPQVITTRKSYKNGKDVGTVELDLLENESDGTKKLFELAGYIVDVLDDGGCLIVDELESKLHPLITKQLVNIFNSNTLNKLNAQLIFTTHDTNLLKGSHLRRDQIWFTEKDRFGSSHLYSLAEYKEKPRKDASLEKDYIRGRFGAIPFIGDFSELARE